MRRGEVAVDVWKQANDIVRGDRLGLRRCDTHFALSNEYMSKLFVESTHCAASIYTVVNQNVRRSHSGERQNCCSASLQLPYVSNEGHRYQVWKPKHFQIVRLDGKFGRLSNSALKLTNDHCELSSTQIPSRDPQDQHDA